MLLSQLKASTMCSLLLLAALATVSSASKCDTWYDTVGHGSSYRNVKDFGAKGDGATDDTAAINTAIQHSMTAVGNKGSAMIYLPSGDYLVSDTLVVYFYTHVSGSMSTLPGCRSRLVLKEGAAGFGDAGAQKPLIATDNGFNRNVSTSPWWSDVVDKNMLFYAQIHNLDISLGETNKGATGILWAVAQQTSLRNLTIDAGGGVSGVDVGDPESRYAANMSKKSPGGGGTVEDVTITGGQYGMRASASQWFFRSVHISNASVAGFAVPNYAWSFMVVDLQVSNCPVGLQIPDSSGTNIQLMASTFTDMTSGAAIAVYSSPSTSTSSNAVDDAATAHATSADASTAPGPLSKAWLLLSGVTTTGTKWVVDRVLPSSSTPVQLWKLSGPVWVQGQPKPAAAGAFDLPATPIADDIPIHGRPAFNGAVSAATEGAKGDGVTDDTQALQNAINKYQTVFLPFGHYLVSNTITLKANTKIVGEGMPFITLAKDAPGFGDVNNPKAMLLTPDDADATIYLADLALNTVPFSQNLGAILLEQRCKVVSFDVHVQLFAPIHTGIHITGDGGGVMSNSWVWAGDHNFTTNKDMTPVLNAATHWEGALSGIRIDSKGPTWLMGTASEHHRGVLYNLTGADRVTMLGSQTENPYWIGGNQTTPACTAKAVEVRDSTNINMYGVVWCSWFCAIHGGIARVINSDVNIFGVWSVGGSPTIAGDHNISDAKFAASIFHK